MQNKRHVHADLIIAWANGATIEYYDDFGCEWSGVESPPWVPRIQYRIKPEPKSAGQVYYETLMSPVAHDTWNCMSQFQRDNLESTAIAVIKAFKENNLV